MSIILNVDKNNGKIVGFAKDISIAEYFENIQIFPLKFLVPITDDEGNVLTNETINAEIPIIGNLFQKNETISDVKVVLVVDDENYVDEEVSLRRPKTLFEVLDSAEDESSVGITSTSLTGDILKVTIGDYDFNVNIKETYTEFYKEDVVKAYDSEKYDFDVVISNKYFDDEIYNVRSFMDTGYYSNGEITVKPGEE